MAIEHGSEDFLHGLAFFGVVAWTSRLEGGRGREGNSDRFCADGSEVFVKESWEPAEDLFAEPCFVFRRQCRGAVLLG